MPGSSKSRRGARTPGSKETTSGADARSFELRPSPIQGTGAFATRWIAKGEKIVEYTGERISNAEADRRYDDEKMRRHHTFLFILNSRTIIDGGSEGNAARFINHSCDPNCEAVIYDNRSIWIEAIRDIEPGEELLYDYQYERTDDHTEDDEEFYVCRCGASNCRGTILAPPKKSKAHHARVKSGARRPRADRGAKKKGPARKKGAAGRKGSSKKKRAARKTVGKGTSAAARRPSGGKRTGGMKRAGKTPASRRTRSSVGRR